jgi:hypothetical protein
MKRSCLDTRKQDKIIIETAIECFKNKAKLNYLGMVEIDQYYIHCSYE